MVCERVMYQIGESIVHCGAKIFRLRLKLKSGSEVKARF